jgi:hypothetical protein
MDTGIRIDGIDPGEHQHTGLDGSKQVHGGDIAPGTIGPPAIDPGNLPPTPLNLRVLSQTQRVVPPGVTVVDVQLAWDDDPDLSYEVQIAPIS